MMLKYLFSLNFFRTSSLFLLFSSSSMAELQDTNKSYTSGGGGFVICTEEGVEKLRNIRLSQMERGELIDPTDPSVLEQVSEKECIFRDTKVVFKKIAPKYNLPASEILVIDRGGEEPCPWAPETRCSRVTASPVHYVESIFLDNDGDWYKGVFVEIGPSFKFLDKPEELQAGDQ